MPISSSSNYYCIQNHNCFTHSTAPFLPSSFSTAIPAISCSDTPFPSLAYLCRSLFPVLSLLTNSRSQIRASCLFRLVFPGLFLYRVHLYNYGGSTLARPIITIRSLLCLNSFFRPEPALWSTPGRRNRRRGLSLQVISSFLGENRGIPLLRGVLSRTKNKI